MEWQDQGILLSTKRLGENKLLATFLTHLHGKQTGLFTQTTSPHYFTPLAHVMQLEWRGRNPEQIGHMTAEPLLTFKAPIPFYTSYLLKNAMLSLLQSFLLSHDPHQALFLETKAFLAFNTTDTDTLLRHYFEWEDIFLTELGYGIQEIDFKDSIEGLSEQLDSALGKMASELGKILPRARIDLMGSLRSHEKMSA